MSRKGRIVVVAGWLCFALALTALPVTPATAQQPAPKLEVLAHLPQDALFVWAAEEPELAADLDEMLGLFQRFAPADSGMNIAGLMAQADEMLGISVRNDLLARLGPEMAVVFDLPPLDSLMGLAMNQSPEMIDRSFANVGLVFQVREQKKFEDALRTALSSLDFAPTETDGVWKLAAPRESEEAPEFAVYWQVRDGWMTFGAGPSWVRGAAVARPQAERFTAGSDFRRLMGHLEANTTSVTYLNLPKLGQLVTNSAVLQGVLAGRPQIAEAIKWLVDDELTMGWAQTKVEMDGGVRITAFGPEILSDGGLSLAVLGGIIGQNFEEALETAKAQAAAPESESRESNEMGDGDDS